MSVGVITPSKQDINELAAQVINGDQKAIEPFYEGVYAWAAMTVKVNYKDSLSTQDREDLTMEACKKVFEAFQSGTYKEGNFTAWLNTLISNAAKDMYFKSAKRMKDNHVQFFSADLDNLGDKMQDATPGPEEESVAADIVSKAMGALPEQQKKVLELREQGFTIPEIANALQIKQSTAQEHCRRAKGTFMAYINKTRAYSVACLPLLVSMLRQDIAEGMEAVPAAVKQAALSTLGAGAATATGTAAAGTTAAASSGAAGTVATGAGIGAKFAALGVAAKAAIITVSAAVVVTGVTVPIVVHNQRQAEQAALILQQEQEAEESRIAYEAEQSRIAEEARIAEESRIAEETRIAEESRAAEEARIAEEERIAEEQAEAERIAEEEAAAEQAAAEAAAQSQTESGQQQGSGGQQQGSGGQQGGSSQGSGGKTEQELVDEWFANNGGTTSYVGKDEPAGGCPNSNVSNPVWDSSVGGWRATVTLTGYPVIVYPNGTMQAG